MKTMIVDIQAATTENFPQCDFAPDPFAEEVWCEENSTHRVWFWTGDVVCRGNFCPDHLKIVEANYERKEMNV